MVQGENMIIEIKKFSLMLSIALLLTIPIVKPLLVTEPIPVGIRTVRGENQRFYFQIQNMHATNSLTCSYSITGIDTILVNPSEGTVTVDVNEIKNVYGTVSVPENAEIKSYNGQLSVKCSSSGVTEGTGSAVQPGMNVRFFVDVLSTQPEGPTPYIPSEKPIPTYNLGMIMLITIIIVLVVGIYFWSERKKK